MGTHKTFNVISTWVKIITRIRAIIAKSILTNELVILDKTKIYFGTYVFLIKEAL